MVCWVVIGSDRSAVVNSPAPRERQGGGSPVVRFNALEIRFRVLVQMMFWRAGT